MTAVVDAAPAAPVRSRLARPAVIGVAAAVAALGWWAWPSIAGHDDRLDVLVVGDEFLQRAERSIELGVRESGRTLDWAIATAGWCTDPVALARRAGRVSPARVVLSFADGEQCLPDLAGHLDGANLLAVVQPGAGPDAETLRAAGFDVVEPERLVGRAGDTRLPCEWWEECDVDGRIAVRDELGVLTEAGNSRLARMIVARL